MAKLSRSLFIVLSLCSGLVMANSSESIAKPRLDFGVLYNDDGWSGIRKNSPKKSMEYLSQMVSELPSLGIDTLMYCSGVSDVLQYPTQVASPFGWNSIQNKQYRPFKENIDAGVDAVMVAGHAANKAGLNFFVSYRMNDNHFISRPDLRSEFYLKHHKEAGFSIGNNPYPNIGIDFGKMPNFAHSQVRQFRLAIIKEHIARYAKVMNGLELDFSRLALMFPDNTGWENRAILTDMLKQIRVELNYYASKLDKTLYLAVRIPPTLKTSQWAGIDVIHWMENNWVDLVIPSQNMTTVMAMPIEDIIAAGKQHNVGVYAGVYQRTAYSYPFKSKPQSQDYALGPNRNMSAAMMRGAVNNYQLMGANNLQLFNILQPFNAADLRLVKAVTEVEKQLSAPRVYAISPNYWFDYGPEKISYKKQLPQPLKNDQIHDFTLYVGEDLRETKGRYVGLRLGLNGQAKSINALNITLNKQLVFQGKPQLLAVKKPKSDKNSPPAVHYYFQLALTNHALRGLLQAGDNHLSIVMKGRVNREVVLSEVKLGVTN